MRTLRKRSSSVCNLPESLKQGDAALAASVFASLIDRARISLRRFSRPARPLAPIRMSASVALRLPGAYAVDAATDNGGGFVHSRLSL